jgi:hypothetical protein
MNPYKVPSYLTRPARKEKADWRRRAWGYLQSRYVHTFVPPDCKVQQSSRQAPSKHGSLEVTVEVEASEWGSKQASHVKRKGDKRPNTIRCDPMIRYHYLTDDRIPDRTKSTVSQTDHPGKMNNRQTDCPKVPTH